MRRMCNLLFRDSDSNCIRFSPRLACKNERAGRLHWFKILTVLAVFTLLSAPAWAQTIGMGEIRGTVTDQTGAVVPGASVEVRNVNTNQLFAETTDASGVYEAGSLMPGIYSVTFKKEGFKTLVRSGIDLGTGAVGVNGVLELGSMVQEVAVIGAAPLVQTETSKQSLEIETKSVTELPTTSNQWYNLTALIPGVSPGFPVSDSGMAQQAGGESVSVSGTESMTQNWLINGGTALFWDSENPDLLAPPIETIQEIDYETHNFGAEYGNGLAVFNVITKSGTNKFHGGLFEYVQNNITSARNFFAEGVPPYRYNRYGGTVGGPIKRDKAFFFFSYSRLARVSYDSFVSVVPTAAERAGDFSAANLGTLYDPNTLTQLANGNYVRTALPGNIIPAGRIDPAAANILKYIGMPNTTAFGPDNYYTSIPTPLPQGWWNLRLDYDFSPSNRLDGSIVVTTPYLPTPTEWSCCEGSISYEESSMQVSDTWNIKPTVVNVARFSGARAGLHVLSSDVGKGYNTSLGIPNLTGNAFPVMSIGGPLSISIGDYGHAVAVESPLDYSDTVAWVKGKHIMKFGGEYAKEVYSQAWPDISAGNFGFSGTFTRNPSDPTSAGLGFADFLFGLPNTWSDSVQEETGVHGGKWQLFINDDYKLRSNLTINLGLRFNDDMGFSEEHNRLSNFSPTLINPATNTPGAICFAGVGGCPTSWPNPAYHVDPRLGVAWAPKPKWSLRAAYGIYDAIFVIANDEANPGPGWEVLGAETASDLIHPIMTLSQGPPLATFPTAAQRTPDYLNGQAIWYVPSHLPLPYVQEWQLDVQHEFSLGFYLDVSYVGTRGIHLSYGRDINAVPPADMQYVPTSPNPLQYSPYPQFLSIAARLDDGFSNYHALQVRAQKRMSRNLGFILNYTWSKTMDTGTSGGWFPGFGYTDVYQQSWNPRANYAPAATNVPQIITGSLVYNLPVGRGQRFLNQGGILNGILGGWEAASIVQLHSGVPFTPVVGTLNLSGELYTGANGAWFPNRVSTGKVSHPTLSEWFDPSAFAIPTTGTFGNSGRNILSGPDWRTWDLSLAKNWHLRWLGEGGQFQFRCDATDLTNHPNFGQPNTQIGTPGAGTITFANTSRNIQFGFRLNF